MIENLTRVCFNMKDFGVIIFFLVFDSTCFCILMLSSFKVICLKVHSGIIHLQEAYKICCLYSFNLCIICDYYIEYVACLFNEKMIYWQWWNNSKWRVKQKIKFLLFHFLSKDSFNWQAVGLSREYNLSFFLKNKSCIFKMKALHVLHIFNIFILWITMTVTEEMQ